MPSAPDLIEMDLPATNLRPEALMSVDELLAKRALFTCPGRTALDNQGPHIIVMDGFYDDPDAIRRLGLDQSYVQYSPPLAEQVGPTLAGEPQFSGVDGRIFTTAMLAFRGIRVRHPVPGFRYNPDWLRRRFRLVVNAEIAEADWEPGGDWWNGAFNLREAGTDRLDTIHHHFHPTNTPQRGWNGIVYLSPEIPDGVCSGTSFWRDRASGRCVAGLDELFSLDRDHFECLCFVPYRYNRLVLFRENVLHKVEGGFGRGKAARLTQSFFFRVQGQLPSEPVRLQP